MNRRAANFMLRNDGLAAGDSARTGRVASNGFARGSRLPAPSSQLFSGAFTLIELLLAIVIFSMILAAVNAVFFGAMKLRQKTADSATKAQPLELTLATLRRDLSGIVLPGTNFAGVLDSAAQIQGLTEQNVGTEIFTTSGVFRDALPWAEIQKIAYVLRDPTNRLSSSGRDLVRIVKRNLLPAAEEQPEEQRLMSDVNRVDFSFYDGSSWRTSWNSTNELTTLPRAIKVEITLEPEPPAPGSRATTTASRLPIQMVVPIMLAAVTNSTATNSTGGVL
jgi:general secretion pathway protein J